MKRFIVTKREVWTQMVEVAAESEQEAIKAVSDGFGEELENTLEYSHTLSVDTWTVEDVGNV